MYSDWDLVSTEEHELNYLLKKYGYSQSIEKRKQLKNIIKSFKNDLSYSPFHHEDFYKYIKDTKAL